MRLFGLKLGFALCQVWNTVGAVLLYVTPPPSLPLARSIVSPYVGVQFVLEN